LKGFNRRKHAFLKDLTSLTKKYKISIKDNELFDLKKDDEINEKRYKFVDETNNKIDFL
jgi:hypothetical protein